VPSGAPRGVRIAAGQPGQIGGTTARLWRIGLLQAEYVDSGLVSTRTQVRAARPCEPGAMNDTFPVCARRTPRTWLPAVIAIAVTGACGMLALADLASAALNDVPPYPHTGWLSAGLLAQAGLGITAVVLLVAGLTRLRGRPVVAVLGWAVIALAIISAAVSMMLGGPTT
jgi:hypothetical protein